MWAMLKKLIRLNLDDQGLCAGVLGGIFVLLHIITALAVKFSGENTSLMLSGVVLPIAAGFLLLCISVGHVLVTFDQALRFGQTRRRALALTLGLTGAEALSSMAAAAALAALERAVAPTFWQWLSGADYIAWGRDGGRRMIPEGAIFVPDPRELFIEDFALDWWWLPLLALGGAALGLIIGAVILRFGKAGAWTLWAFWMAHCFVLPYLPWETHTVTDVLLPALGTAAAAAFLWSVWSLLRATVKS